MVSLLGSFWLHDLWHPLSGNGYQFWSGIGSDITELAMLGWLYAFLRKHNCSSRGCWRIGRHPVAGTTYVVCRKHHPHDKPTAESILQEHEEAMAAPTPTMDLRAIQAQYEETSRKGDQAFERLSKSIEELTKRLDRKDAPIAKTTRTGKKTT